MIVTSTATERTPAVRRLALDARPFELVSSAILRYGLVLFLIGGGLTKFTEAEAIAIEPWVAHSPLLGWLYAVTSTQATSSVLGVVELTLGVLLALRRWRPGVSTIGSFGACIMFIITLSFLFTTPELSMDAQGFLMKDLPLFGAAVWTAADSLRATRRSHC
jgi:reactive chlorine resistance protein C